MKAARRPGIEVKPLVRAGREHLRLRLLEFALVFEIVAEEREFDLIPIVFGGRAVEYRRANSYTYECWLTLSPTS